MQSILANLNIKFNQVTLRSVPKEEPIDLLNVSFGNYDSTPDRVSAVASLEDLQKLAPERTWNLIKVLFYVSVYLYQSSAQSSALYSLF